MRLYPVDSTSIAALAYVPERRELWVRFHGRGQLYAYEDVSASEYQALMQAESKGAFINRHIKPRHPYRRFPHRLASHA